MNNRNLGLKVEIKDGKLVIEIGVSTLANAVLVHLNDEHYWYNREVSIVDEDQFVKDLVSEMLEEDEVGNNLLTLMLDRSGKNADWSEGIDIIDKEPVDE